MITTILIWIWTLSFWTFFIWDKIKPNDIIKGILGFHIFVLVPILGILVIIFGEIIIGIIYLFLWCLLIIAHLFYIRKRNRSITVKIVWKTESEEE